MNPAEYDWKALAYGALGGLIVLTVVCVAALLVVREFWTWAKNHLGTFDSLSATAKGGKVQLGAVIEDMRLKAPEAKPDQNGAEPRDHMSLS